jgi:hypothetical protein
MRAPGISECRFVDTNTHTHTHTHTHTRTRMHIRTWQACTHVPFAHQPTYFGTPALMHMDRFKETRQRERETMRATGTDTGEVEEDGVVTYRPRGSGWVGGDRVCGCADAERCWGEGEEGSRAHAQARADADTGTRTHPHRAEEGDEAMSDTFDRLRDTQSPRSSRRYVGDDGRIGVRAWTHHRHEYCD